MKKDYEIKFRASGVGALMSNNANCTISEAQLKTIAKLEAKEQLTTKEKSELTRLKKKRDAPFMLSEGAKSYVRLKYLRDEYGYYEPLITNEILKGQMCEQDAFELCDDVMPLDGIFRYKNLVELEDNFFTGTPDFFDHLGLSIVEDVKCPWNVKTFQDADMPKLYFTQLQVYMRLTGARKARLIYCLVSTPQALIDRLLKKYYYQLGRDEDNPMFQEICEKINAMHKVDWIPAKDRIKVFEFDYDESYMNELIRRVKYAREYYRTLTLNGTKRFKK